MKTRNTQESLKKQIKDINMKNNEIFSIIRLGTYALYEKSIVGVDAYSGGYPFSISGDIRSVPS